MEKEEILFNQNGLCPCLYNLYHNNIYTLILYENNVPLSLKPLFSSQSLDECLKFSQKINLPTIKTPFIH